MADNYQFTEGSGKTARARDNSSVWTPAVNIDPCVDGGLTPYRNLDLNSTGVNLKTSAGQIYQAKCFNRHATDFRYVKIYDKASAPSSSDTPIETWMLPPKGGLVFSGTMGTAHSLGIGLRATTGIADNDTGAPSTNDVIVNIGYK